jgi:hypothetical protein
MRRWRNYLPISGVRWKTVDVIKGFHWLSYAGGEFSTFHAVSFPATLLGSGDAVNEIAEYVDQVLTQVSNEAIDREISVGTFHVVLAEELNVARIFRFAPPVLPSPSRRIAYRPGLGRGDIAIGASNQT